MNGFRSVLDLLEHDEDGASGLSSAHGSWWVSRLSVVLASPEVPTAPAVPGRLLSAWHECVTAVLRSRAGHSSPAWCPPPRCQCCSPAVLALRFLPSELQVQGCTEPPARAGPQHRSGEPGRQARASGVREHPLAAVGLLRAKAAVSRAPARCWGVTRRNPLPAGADTLTSLWPPAVNQHTCHPTVEHRTGAEVTGGPREGDARRETGSLGVSRSRTGQGRSPGAGQNRRGGQSLKVQLQVGVAPGQV